MRTYLVGGGIGSLAAAAFLIRDAGVLGDDISILEQEPVLGGSLDGAGDSAKGYSVRGGRMLTTDNYECTWDLFKSLPSLDAPGQSVFDETVEFNVRHPSHSMARLVDRRCAKVPVTSMGFTMQDRLALLKLARADEDALGSSRITDWLSPGFYETAFWTMWATTFAFQPWHSAVEFKRNLHRRVFRSRGADGCLRADGDRPHDSAGDSARQVTRCAARGAHQGVQVAAVGAMVPYAGAIATWRAFVASRLLRATASRRVTRSAGRQED